MNYIVDVIKKNIKFFAIMLSVILIGIFGITYAIRIGNAALIGIDISTANVDVDITYDDASDENFVSAGKMMPIEDNLVTYNSTDERVIKNKFYVTGKSTNPDNTIYDIALHDINIDCELRSEDLKWKLFKNGVELSSGNMSPTFDSMDDNRLVLTNIQEDLTTTRVEYVFVMWVSESCTGDIKTCNKKDNQNKYLGKNISANIKVELTTKSKKELVRKVGSNLSCNYISVDIPTSGSLIYNGQSQTFYASSDSYSLVNNSGVNAGTYNVTAKLNSGYKWDDNSTEDKHLKYSIEKRNLTVTASDQTITYGSTINNSAYIASNLVSGHSVESVSLDSSISDTGNGTITPSAVKIVDSNNNDVTSNYSINYKKGSLKITCDNSSIDPTVEDKIYNGQKQVGVSGGSNIELGGVTAAVQAGDYIANATPSKNYCWSNYSTNKKEYNWSIAKNSLRLSLNNKIVNYNGNEVSIDPAVVKLPDNTVVEDVNVSYQYYSGFSCDNNLKLTGKPVNAGEYSVKATSGDYNGYDGGTSNCATITINKIDPILTLSSSFGDITYGQSDYRTYTINPSDINISGCGSSNVSIATCNYDTANKKITVTGTGVGFVYVVFDTNESVNYKSKTFSYPISVVCARTATEPNVSNKTYNGGIQTGVSGGSNVTLGGTISARNAGNYTGTATPKANYCWSNGTRSTKNYDWSIAKAQGSCSITSVPALQYPERNSGTLSYSCTGDGAISVSSSNTSVITVNQSTKTNTSVTLNSVGNGSSTINLSQADGTNYLGSSDSATINVNQSNYTVEYYLGNNTSTPSATLLGSQTCSINSDCSLNSWGSLNGTVPFSDKGWNFAGWSTSTNGTIVNFRDGEIIASATGGNVIKLYAVFKRDITNYSGINKATSQTSTQYYNPYCYDTTNCTSNYSTHSVPTPASIDGWTYLGSTVGTSATSSYFTGNGQRGPNGDPTYYAIYSRSISIAYNANGGSGTISNSTVTQKYNSANNIESVGINLKDNTFTKSHYHFSGWGDSSTATSGTNAGASYTFSPGVSDSASKTLYAIWTANKSIVKYSTNGGDILGETTYDGSVYQWSRNLSTNNGLISRSNANGTTMSVFYKTYTYGDTAKDLNDYNASNYMKISRTGYKATSGAQWKCLSGNCTQSTYNQATDYGSTDFCDNTNGDCEVILGVNWTGISYTVNFYRGNHTATPGATKLGSQTCTYGTGCTLKTWSNLGGSVPVSGVGWSFYGWTTSSSGTSRGYADGDSVTNLTSTDGGTVSLYALFSRNMIYYSGIDKASSTNVKQYYNPYCYDTTNCTSYYTSTATPDVTSVSGWTYKGFSTGTTATSSTYSSFKRNPEGSNKVYAVYERTVTVSYNANGGSGTAPSNSTGTQYYNTDGAVSTPSITTRSNTFTRTGYTFVAWGTSTSSTSGTASGSSYSFSNGVSSSATKTLYAIWRKTITITFNKNNAYSISSNSKTCYMYNADTSCSITSPTISVAYGKNYWDDSYANVFTVVGFNTSSSATSSSWSANTSKNVSSNATYYAITKFNTSSGKTFKNTATGSGDPGLNVRSSASASGTKSGTLTDGCTLTISNGSYVSSESTYKIWFKVTNYSNCTCSGTCTGWVAGYYVNF